LQPSVGENNHYKIALVIKLFVVYLRNVLDRFSRGQDTKNQDCLRKQGRLSTITYSESSKKRDLPVSRSKGRCGVQDVNEDKEDWEDTQEDSI